MSGPRWFCVLVLVLVVASAGDARAQVFKPRNGKGSAKVTPVKKGAAAPAAAPSKQPTRTSGVTPRRVVTSEPAATKSKTAEGKGRPNDLTPDPVKKKKKKGDVVISDDDDDDDVKIKDD